MTREEWTRARDVLTRAVLLPPSEQQAAVDTAFIHDAIRRELHEVLRRTNAVLPRIGLSPASVAGSGTPAGAPGVPAGYETPQPLLAPGQIVRERFGVVRQLGRGGMGEVYLAHDRNFATLVALKVLYQAELSEAQRARQCSGHPHIVTIHETFDIEAGDGARTVLVLDYVPGRAASRLVADGPLNLRDVVRWAREVTAAMAHAHDCGVLHCDLKPANILITPDQGAKVIDFGIGRSTFERANPIAPRRGTLEYMAPEQLVAGEFSEAGDIYSLGTTLFELVTARLPFEGDTPQELILQIVGTDAPRASSLRDDVPEKLDELLARALAKDPNKRFRSARALDRALEAVEWDLTTNTSPVPAPFTAMPQRRLQVLVYAERAVQILALAAVSGLLASWTFNLIIDRPFAFDPDALAGALTLGVQSLVLPAAVVAATMGFAGVAQLLFRGIAKARLVQRIAAATRSLVPKRHEDATTTLAQSVLLIAFLALALVLIQFEDIVGSFAARLTADSPAALEPLHPANRERQIVYRISVPILLAAVLVGWRSVRTAAKKYGTAIPTGVRAATISLIVLLAILIQAPYRLTVNTAFPVVLLDGQRCYVLGERESESRVYCPGWQPPRVRTVAGAGARVMRCEYDENVFVGKPATTCDPQRAIPESQ